MIIAPQLVGVAKAAAEMGERVAAMGLHPTVCGPEEAIAPSARSGLETLPIPAHPLGGPTLPKPKTAADRSAEGRRRRRAEATAQLPLDALVDAFQTVRPDLALIDAELHPAIILALGRRRLAPRTALFTTMFPGAPALTAPPPHVDATPGRGVFGSKIGVGALWMRYWIDRRLRDARRRRRAAGGAYPSVLSALAKAEGVDLARQTTRWRWQLPFAWTTPPLLVLQSRAMDLPGKPPSQVRYVGPMTTSSPVSPPSADDARLIAAAETARGDGRRVVYAAFGSIAAQRKGFVDQLWSAAAARPNWLLIQALGRGETPATTPPNVMTTPWAPQRALLTHANAAVIHAGVNSIVDCIETSTPIATAPFAVNDQYGNAARVVFHGLGERVDAGDGIGAIVDEIAVDRGVADALTQMRAAFAKDRELNRFERAIDALLAEPTSRSDP